MYLKPLTAMQNALELLQWTSYERIQSNKTQVKHAKQRTKKNNRIQNKQKPNELKKGVQHTQVLRRRRRKRWTDWRERVIRMSHCSKRKEIKNTRRGLIRLKQLKNKPQRKWNYYGVEIKRGKWTRNPWRIVLLADWLTDWHFGRWWAMSNHHIQYHINGTGESELPDCFEMEVNRVVDYSVHAWIGATQLSISMAMANRCAPL